MIGLNSSAYLWILVRTNRMIGEFVLFIQNIVQSGQMYTLELPGIIICFKYFVSNLGKRIDNPFTAQWYFSTWSNAYVIGKHRKQWAFTLKVIKVSVVYFTHVAKYTHIHSCSIFLFTYIRTLLLVEYPYVFTVYH